MASAEPKDQTTETAERACDPCVMVIFGAAGDLTKRLLIPSLYNLARGKLLAKQFAVVGVSVEPFSTPEFRARISADVQEFATSTVEKESVGMALQSALLPRRRLPRSQPL